jgi:hypothetical protein
VENRRGLGWNGPPVAEEHQRAAEVEVEADPVNSSSVFLTRKRRWWLEVKRYGDELGRCHYVRALVSAKKPLASAVCRLSMSCRGWKKKDRLGGSAVAEVKRGGGDGRAQLRSTGRGRAAIMELRPTRPTIFFPPKSDRLAYHACRRALGCE